MTKSPWSCLPLASSSAHGVIECPDCSGTGLVKLERFFSHFEGTEPFDVCPRCAGEKKIKLERKEQNGNETTPDS